MLVSRARERTTVIPQGAAVEPVSPPSLLAFHDVETAFDHPDRIGRLAGLLGVRDDDTLLLDAGDATAMGALAVVADGRAEAVAFHRAVAPDVHVPGNHDFDEGLGSLADFVAATPGEWLAANAPALDLPAHTVLAAGDERVGVVGVCHPETPDICRAVRDVAFGDPVAAARRELSALRDRGVDHTVVLSHCGALDADIAAATDADAVVGGHDHERTVDRVEGTLVARSAGVGREVVTVDLGETPAATVDSTAGAPADDRVAEAYRERHADTGLDAPVASPGTGVDESAVVRFVADAYRARADADAGLAVSAAVREPLPAEVRERHLVGTVPFDSHLVAVAVRGERLKAALRACRGPLDDTHGPVRWAGADPDALTVGGTPVRDEETYRVGCTTYETVTELLPGVADDRVVDDRGSSTTTSSRTHAPAG
ncbi:5'-nucleotidase C-terminal domain-containing protein [Halobaculum litoreum]|uniref:5'-nucleotidase C-terminal domain-containing protein n=1 Tax=Halobaculum litoreum TaxID=3031998 RepID=A0ABD5XTL4_9EURY